MARDRPNRLTQTISSVSLSRRPGRGARRLPDGTTPGNQSGMVTGRRSKVTPVPWPTLTIVNRREGTKLKTSKNSPDIIGPAEKQARGHSVSTSGQVAVLGLMLSFDKSLGLTGSPGIHPGIHETGVSSKECRARFAQHFTHDLHAGAVREACSGPRPVTHRWYAFWRPYWVGSHPGFAQRFATTMARTWPVSSRLAVTVVTAFCESPFLDRNSSAGTLQGTLLTMPCTASQSPPTASERLSI